MMKASLNQLLRKYVQEYKHELKIMDEDEDENDEKGVEEMAKNLQISLDEELLGVSAGNEDSKN